eukprot:1175743-Prorocentrum_minimum.AAC.3
MMHIYPSQPRDIVEFEATRVGRLSFSSEYFRPKVDAPSKSDGSSVSWASLARCGSQCDC